MGLSQPGRDPKYGMGLNRNHQLGRWGQFSHPSVMRLSRHSRARTLSLLELALCIRPVPQGSNKSAGWLLHSAMGKQGMVISLGETPMDLRQNITLEATLLIHCNYIIQY